MTARRTTAQALAVACEPLIGRHHGVCLHSPRHGGHVSLWIQALTDGRLQVDAVYPMDGYRVLFKERYDDGAQARQAWRARYLELFGMEPLE